MPSEGSTAGDSEPAAIPLSTVFCADDADVVIRTAEPLDFHVHKPILSLVSPVFKAMFTLPQPPTNTPDTLPHIDVEESAGTWENILRTIYPMSHPIIDNLDDLESLLLTAKKYEMRPIIDIYKKGLENPTFIREYPLRLYAIACTHGLEDQAKYVARNAKLLTVTKQFDAGDPRGVTLGSYHNLVSFLVERDDEWYKALDQAYLPAGGRFCKCDELLREKFYNKIKQNLKGSYLQAEKAYFEALEDQSRSSREGCASGDCLTSGPQMKSFIEGVVREKESVCDKLMREKQYVQWQLFKFHPQPPSSVPAFQVYNKHLGEKRVGIWSFREPRHFTNL